MNSTESLQLWRPIATAPKDGTHILTCDPEGRIVEIYWHISPNKVCPWAGWMANDGVETELGDHSIWQPQWWVPAPDTSWCNGSYESPSSPPKKQRFE